MDQIEISVIMTVKNGAKYLESSLSSIFAQTCPPKEIVVVNDGSSDDTWDELNKWRLMAPIPLRLLNTHGVGRSAALNLAVSHSQYPWLANIDVDDIWLPEKLEQQALVVSRYPDSELVVTASHIVYGEVSGELDAMGEFSVTSLGPKDFYIRNPINHSSVVFSRRLYNQLGGYNETLVRQVDIDLWIRALRDGYVFYRIDLPLTVKRLHDGQSYEVGSRLRYTFSSFKISLKKLWLLKAPFYYFTVPFVKFVYNNIPRGVRHRLMR